MSPPEMISRTAEEGSPHTGRTRRSQRGAHLTARMSSRSTGARRRCGGDLPPPYPSAVEPRHRSSGGMVRYSSAAQDTCQLDMCIDERHGRTLSGTQAPGMLRPGLTLNGTMLSVDSRISSEVPSMV